MSETPEWLTEQLKAATDDIDALRKWMKEPDESSWPPSSIQQQSKRSTTSQQSKNTKQPGINMK